MSEMERRLERANEKGRIIGNRVLLRYEDRWHHLISLEMLARIRNRDYKEYNEITGKYLFFSPNLPRLIEIGVHEILQHSFHIAKVRSRLVGNIKEYVLCLYYRDESRKQELANRCKTDYPDLHYRYWKSNESTRRREYSQEFLSKLDSATRKEFSPR